jgi:2-polyprenyl-3-methyl-5-hydroxy-6-metoxy-1,4-benzoquinol methylase
MRRPVSTPGLLTRRRSAASARFLTVFSPPPQPARPAWSTVHYRGVMTERAPDDVQARWDALAGYWDEQIEAGRTWQRVLVAPAVQRLLELKAGERIVDLACGNGEFARQMAAGGAQVLATDFSNEMLERARRHGGPVEYRRADLTKVDDILALGPPSSFAAAVANMAIMDMTTLRPMAEAVATLVQPGGRLVLSTLHPAFNSGGIVWITEQHETEDGLKREHSIKRATYLTPTTTLSFAIEDQPVGQWHFHRPLELILEPFFASGWVVDGMLEPPLMSSPFHAELPGVIVIRCRKPA